jgi:hypothetical protein
VESFDANFRAWKWLAGTLAPPEEPAELAMIVIAAVLVRDARLTGEPAELELGAPMRLAALCWDAAMDACE